MSADTPENCVAEFDTCVSIDGDPVRVRTETNGEQTIAVVEAPGVDLVVAIDVDEFDHLRDQGRANALAYDLATTFLGGDEP